MSTPQIILASNSPRRKELLGKAGIDFKVIISGADENIALPPKELVEALSLKKAQYVANNNKNCIVIGADTVVALNNTVLGKPESEENAYKMLKSLSGNTHEVYTGVSIVCVGKNAKSTFSVCSRVTFKTLSDETIKNYIKTKEPMDKAGAYGIQGLGGNLVLKYEGSYDNIVGLPVDELLTELDLFIKTYFSEE